MKEILLFSGSNNPQSINQQLIGAIAGRLAGTNNTVIDLMDYDMPVYSVAVQNARGVPAAVLQLKQQIDAAGLLIISVPEHNGLMPAFFKNILDWLSRAGPDYRVFYSKPVILLSAAPGAGGAGALQHTETVLNRLGARVKAKIVVNRFFSKTHSVENKLRLADDAVLNEIQKIITTINS